MAIGNLDRRITFYSSTATRDTFGEAIPTWSVFRSTWAWLRPANVSEGEKSNKITANETVRFVVRHRSDYTEKMRILYNGSYYDVRGLQEVGRKKYLDITAERSV